MTEHVNPPEPKGLGAVIVTRRGLMVRYAVGSLAPWIAVDGGENMHRPFRYYDDQTVIDVISEGVRL
ncbi:hypothetical protein [Kribbella sp. NPDC050470]|uniref:hypothetical protein n=1 Tax=unclassified Kribbella TaxID=2644121 RepID=UPI0037BDE653